MSFDQGIFQHTKMGVFQQECVIYGIRKNFSKVVIEVRQSIHKSIVSKSIELLLIHKR